jgi:hypothetical protein
VCSSYFRGGLQVYNDKRRRGDAGDDHRRRG